MFRITHIVFALLLFFATRSIDAGVYTSAKNRELSRCIELMSSADLYPSEVFTVQHEVEEAMIKWRTESDEGQKLFRDWVKSSSEGGVYKSDFFKRFLLANPQYSSMLIDARVLLNTRFKKPTSKYKKSEGRSVKQAGEVSGSLRTEFFDEPKLISEGHLDVGELEGHKIYYRVSGNPKGEPVVIVLGGPGAEINPNTRKFFDPNHFMIIEFEPRGCGASTYEHRFKFNDTFRTIRDMEKLRKHLKIPEWDVFGGSWASTVSIIYAIENPERVKSLILRGLFLPTQGTAEYFFKRSLNDLLPHLRKPLLDLLEINSIDQFEGRLYEWSESDSVELQTKAVQALTALEGALAGADLNPSATIPSVTPDEVQKMRMEIYYWKYRFFIPARYFDRHQNGLKGISAILIQGELDQVTAPAPIQKPAHSKDPSVWAYLNAGVLRDVSVVQIKGEAHSPYTPGMKAALLQATERLRVTGDPR